MLTDRDMAGTPRTITGEHSNSQPREETRWPRAAAARPVGIVTVARAHWPVVAVLALYALSAFVVPTMTPAAVADDWIYARSVEALVHRGEFQVLPISAPTAVFQVAWGALFASLFGMTFGALRLSTVVLVLVGGWALYGLCRELAVDRASSALAVAAYLFNPLSFVLGFSFMTDAPFTALLVVATYGYTRGLRDEPSGARATLAGSVAAALAFLVRPHGALVPLAVVGYLLVTGRFRLNRAGALLFFRVVAVPVVAAVLFYLWSGRGVPSGQESFLRSIEAAGWQGGTLLVQRMTFIGAMYLGFFALPIVAGAVVRGRSLVRFGPGTSLGWLLFAAWEALIVAGVTIFSGDGHLMPYIPQFVAPWGLGPTDLAGIFPPLVDRRVLKIVTGICAVGALVLGLALCRGVGAGASSGRRGAGLVAAIGLGQAAGVLPPSFPFRDWTVSLDRYLLPLLPFAVCLGVWALQDVRLTLPVAWLVAAAFAVFSVAGTRDFLVFQGATWDMAREATARGVPLPELDGGYAWDGYHLWGTTQADPPAPRDGPWWTWWWTPGNVPVTDSTYVVSTVPLRGFDVVHDQEYSSWLRAKPTRLYLLHRQQGSGPPSQPLPAPPGG